nr:LTP-s2=lipid transfer protein {N-terminal} [spinach, leaves, Peptide Partial, 21 aa] [Spinacia oleracea]
GITCAMVARAPAPCIGYLIGG